MGVECCGRASLLPLDPTLDRRHPPARRRPFR